jgi:hypothetical protein
MTFNPTFLYIKQHSVTGKLYFGKYSGKKIDKYFGSGRYWTSHIKKHGKEHVVNLWYCLFYDEQDCKDFALSFSKQQNIVKSKEWANEVVEDGIGGWYGVNAAGLDFTGYSSRQEKWRAISPFRHPELYSDEIHLKIKHNREKSIRENKSWMKGISACNEFWKNNPELRKQNLEKSKSPKAIAKKKQKFKEIKHQQGEKNSQFGTFWITNEVESVKIKKTDLIPKGWRKGRKMKLIPS